MPELPRNVYDHLPYLIFLVKDLARSEEFYRDRLGLVVRKYPLESAMGRTALALSVQGTTILLMSDEAGDFWVSPEAGPIRPMPGQCFPSFQVESLEEFHQQARAQGVKIVQEPRPDLFGHAAVYCDPDDLLFSVVEKKPARQREGIVLSGGGALGAFELGVLEVLAGQARPLNPVVITGTSVGGYNAAVLACELGAGASMKEAVATLTRHWRDRVAGGFNDNGVFRLRGDLARLMYPKLGLGKVLVELAGDAGYLAASATERLRHIALSGNPASVRVSELAELSALISTEPLDELVRSTLRFHDLKKSPASLKLATTDWKNGRLRVFCHESGHTRARHRKQDADISEQNFMKAVLASTAIPGIFPTVPVLVKPEEGEGEPEERRFADGGLVMNTPLNPAIEAGATKIHLLCLNPDMNQIAQNTLENTLDTLTRALVATVAGSIHTDLEQVQLVNRIAGIVRRKSSDQFYDAVEVHRYHPTPGNLGGLAGILDFSSKHVEALIADGRAVAATHDCAAAHCVIPERR